MEITEIQENDYVTDSREVINQNFQNAKDAVETDEEAFESHVAATTPHENLDIYSIIPNGAEVHNCFYRGKDLTSYFASGEMSTAIANGTFKDIFIGDYIKKSVTVNGTAYNDVIWRVASLDYHLNRGDTETTAHHCVLVPDSCLGTAQMNSTNTIGTTGYVGSQMWTKSIPLYASGIANAFGSSHVLSHRELLSTASSTTAASAAGAGWTGASTGRGWRSVTVNIMNNMMINGAKAFSSSGNDVGECNEQLALFRLAHPKLVAKRTLYWTRDIASSADFCVVGGWGDATTAGASDACGVRPYFLLR